MATINTAIIVFSASLAPGGSENWNWNNPDINAVYAFSAVVHSNFSAPTANLAVEISPLRYGYNVGTDKRRIEYTVKNLTQQPLNYEIHMSVAR
jgi:hypothetical protein